MSEYNHLIFKLPSLSIVVPVYNCEKTINATLESIEKSITTARKHFPEFQCEVLIINDVSTDSSERICNEFIKGKPDFKLILNEQNVGAGPSRNKGAKLAQNQLLMFMDGDDLYFDDHIYRAIHFFQQTPAAHFIYTKVRIDEPILPEWKIIIENSLPINICLWKWVHDMIGGFHEEEIFKTYPCEDADYRKLLTKYFVGFQIEQETVHHFRYPGNALDRQMDKFTQPKSANIDTLRPQEREARPKASEIQYVKDQLLKAKFTAWQEQLTKAIAG